MGDHTIGQMMDFAAQREINKRRLARINAAPIMAPDKLVGGQPRKLSDHAYKVPPVEVVRKEALAILDRVCMPHRGRDAEFESTCPDNPTQVHPDFGYSTDPHPSASLGMLMIEAFAPNGAADLPKYEASVHGGDKAADDAHDLWEAEVEIPFRRRYKFV